MANLSLVLVAAVSLMLMLSAIANNEAFDNVRSDIEAIQTAIAGTPTP